MAELLKGAPVARALTENMQGQIETLKEQNITPTLALLRVGDRPDDVAYEKSAGKKCDKAGVRRRNIVLPSGVTKKEFYQTLEELNRDPNVHGILMLRPIPKELDNELARRTLTPEKDVDGCTDGSLTGVFTGEQIGYPPCTAQAAMEILRYYGIDCTGKRAVVIGRSLVVGRPVALMLLHQNATVTICHTKTEDVSSVARQADILIACSGQMESIGREYFNDHQIVIDVGIGWNEKKGKLCGDVIEEEAAEIVRGYTPVPGGVGTVTTSIMISHVVEAAMRAASVSAR